MFLVAYVKGKFTTEIIFLGDFNTNILSVRSFFVHYRPLIQSPRARALNRELRKSPTSKLRVKVP